MKLPNTSTAPAFPALALAVSLLTPLFAAAQPGKAPVPGLDLAWLPRDSRDSVVLSARITLPAGWYINSNLPLDSFLVPTRLEVAAAPGFAGPLMEFGEPRYPAPVIEYSQAMAGDMSLFKTSFEILVTGKGPKREKGGGKDGKPASQDGNRAALPSPPPPVEATLHYQSCDGTMCWPPKSVTARLP